MREMPASPPAPTPPPEYVSYVKFRYVGPYKFHKTASLAKIAVDSGRWGGKAWKWAGDEWELIYEKEEK